MKLAVVASHPIQYQAPIFRRLASSFDTCVYFGHLPDSSRQGSGFGIAFQWDVPVLEGYRFEIFAEGLDSKFDFGGRWHAFRHLRKRWREVRPDVVLHTGWHHPCMLPALAAARSLGIPCMLRCEANLLFPRNILQRLWHRWILARYAAFLPIGRANADYYEAFGPRETPRFPAPYASGGQFGGNADRAASRARFGISSDAFCFLFAGKFVPKKRPADLLRAAALVAPSGRIHVLLVGSGEQEAELRNLAEPFSGRVTFAGFLNQGEMPGAYAAADCLVLPSDAGETWGLVINEAMMFGLPAIVSDQVGAVADLVDDGVTGCVFPCGDVERLADCLRRMSSDPAGARRMGGDAKTRVADYSTEAAADGIRRAASAVTAEETKRPEAKE